MFYIPGVYNASVLLTAGMEFASVQMAFLHTMDRVPTGLDSAWQSARVW